MVAVLLVVMRENLRPGFALGMRCAACALRALVRTRAVASVANGLRGLAVLRVSQGTSPGRGMLERETMRERSIAACRLCHERNKWACRAPNNARRRRIRHCPSERETVARCDAAWGLVPDNSRAPSARRSGAASIEIAP